MVLPAITETTTVCGPRIPFTCAAASSSNCGLIASSQDFGRIRLNRIKRDAAFRAETHHVVGRPGVEDGHAGGLHAIRKKAFEHGAAHLAGADEDERGGKVGDL